LELVSYVNKWVLFLVQNLSYLSVISDVLILRDEKIPSLHQHF